MRVAFLCLGCLLAVLALPRRAEAHGLSAECRIDGNQVHFEAYYDDDAPARAAKVRVENAAGTSVAEGRTDGDGRWSFALPPGGTYRVIVDAGAGHRKTLQLTVPGGDATAHAEATAPSERAEFARVHWARLGGGMAIIVMAAVAVWLVLRQARPTS